MAEVITLDELPASIQEYAKLLHNRLLTSWTAARDATLESQSDAVADTTRTQDTQVKFVLVTESAAANQVTLIN